MSNFFSNALRQAMKDKHFNQAQLAEHLNVDPAYISRWLKGSSPRLDQLTSVLNVLGWNLDRARPDYDAFSDAIETIEQSDPSKGKSRISEKGSDYKNLDEIRELLSDVAENRKSMDVASIQLAGSVRGDSGVVTLKESKNRSLTSAEELFEELAYAENDIFYLDVTSDSTDPLVQKGTRLFFRKVLRHQSVPSNAIVILESVANPEQREIRRLVRLRDEATGRVDRLVGAPLSKDQDFIYFKPRDMKLAAVLIGTMTYPYTKPLES